MAVSPAPTTPTRGPTTGGAALAHEAQELDPVEHARGILARQPEALALLGADRDEDGAEPVAAQAGHGHVAADADAIPELHAEALQDRQVLRDLRLRQAIGRDRPADHAAGVRVLLEDRDRGAGAREPLRGGEPGRTGADDRDAGGARPRRRPPGGRRAVRPPRP